MALRAVAVARVSHASGKNNLPYISRSEAIRPDQSRKGQPSERGTTVFKRREHNRDVEVKGLASDARREKAISKDTRAEQDVKSSLHEADVIWTWNAPGYVTGDHDGTSQRSERNRKAMLEQGLKLIGAKRLEERELTLEEKAENARAYFELLSDCEKKKGGVNSYRVVLTVGGEASNLEMKHAVNDFLRENFPTAQALVAVHRNTAHVHAHLYAHSRQLDGKKIDLKQDYFRLDEKWAKVCSERFNDQSIYDEHMRLKAETRQYKRDESQARREQTLLPAKNERWADQYEILRGVLRPWDDRFVGRLMAAARLAETRAEYLKVVKAPDSQMMEADHEANDLRTRLDSVSAKRALSRSESKRGMPAEVITVKEQKEIARYTSFIKVNGLPIRQRSHAGQPKRLVQTGFDFETPPPQQPARDFVSSASEKIVAERATNSNTKLIADKPKINRKGSTKRPNKREHGKPPQTQFEFGRKDQHQGNERDKRIAEERIILGRALVARAEVEQFRAELARAREGGDKWHLKIYDATHKRERLISEFEIRRRSNARAVQSTYAGELTSRIERHEKQRQVFKKDFERHHFEIAHHKEMVHQIVQSLEERLSVAQREYDLYRPQALAIQDRYAKTNTQSPLPMLTISELNRLQDQAVAAQDPAQLLALENVREALASELGEPARTDFELARLRGQFTVAGSDQAAHKHRGEGFESKRHLMRWEIGGETWSLAEVDQQLRQFQEEARVLTDPKALIPNILSYPGRETARLVRTLGKNLNLSPSKRHQATLEVSRLMSIREQVQERITAQEEVLQSEMQRTSGISKALGEIVQKEISRREHSEQKMPAPLLTGSDLSRLEANAQKTKDSGLLKQFHSLEAEHFQRQASDKRQDVEKLFGRVVGREIVAEMAARENEERLADFEARREFAQVTIKDSEGRWSSTSIRDLKDPRRLIEYVATRAFESKERRHMRIEVERAIKAQHFYLKNESGKAHEALELMREYRHQLFGKADIVPQPIFTPNEISTIELYGVRQTDPKVAAHYYGLIERAEKEARVLTSGREGGFVETKKAAGRVEVEKSRGRRQSAQEQKISEAHAQVLKELRCGAEQDELFRAPREFAVSFSEQVRDGLQKEHGLSIKDLGFTNENWSRIVVMNLRTSFNSSAKNPRDPVIVAGARQIESMINAINHGDERLIARLSGVDHQSPAYEMDGIRDQSFNQKDKDQALTRDQSSVPHRRDGGSDHAVPIEQEYSKTDRLEHIIEHFFIR